MVRMSLDSGSKQCLENLKGKLFQHPDEGSICLRVAL